MTSQKIIEQKKQMFREVTLTNEEKYKLFEQIYQTCLGFKTSQPKYLEVVNEIQQDIRIFMIACDSIEIYEQSLLMIGILTQQNKDIAEKI